MYLCSLIYVYMWNVSFHTWGQGCVCSVMLQCKYRLCQLQMHIQQKNTSECLSYYAVFKVLQKMTINAHLFDIYNYIYYHADKLWWDSNSDRIQNNEGQRKRYVFRMKSSNDQIWAAGIKKPFNIIFSFRMLKCWGKVSKSYLNQSAQPWMHTFTLYGVLSSN